MIEATPGRTLSIGEASPPALHLHRHGACRILTLDRPASRNALDTTTTTLLAEQFPRLARDADTYAVVLRSSKAGVFCAGGDIRQLATAAEQSIADAGRMLAAEYRLVWLLDCFSKPVVSLIDGMVMGGGAGITLVNTHRVAASEYGFAMPEVRIGFLPDDGVAATLGRLPDEIGTFLALTGQRIGRADAYALGLVTHCIDAAQYAEIEDRLADCTPVDPLLDQMHRDPGPGRLAPLRASIAGCFGAPTVVEIMSRLRSAADGAATAAARDWAAAALADMTRASPLALKVALRHVRQSRALDLRQTLMIDYRVGMRMLAGQNFREGVRAAVIDKDHDPKWQPATLGEISDTSIEELFKSTPETTLVLPTRQEMQGARV